MFSRYYLTILFFSLAGAGCGVLGTSEDENKTIVVPASNLGCLNVLGEKIHQFVEGDVSPMQWNDTWNCLADSMTAFKNFIRPGTSEGYTREDIRLFVSNFLITNKKITPELIQSLFILKSVLIGGTSEVLKKVEIDKFIDLVRVFQEESVPLIPSLKKRFEEPNLENTFSLIEAVQFRIKRLLVGFQPDFYTPLTEASLATFLKELSALFNTDLDLAPTILALKSFLVGGDTKSIMGEEWKRLFEEAPHLVLSVAALKLVKAKNEAENYLLYERVLQAVYDILKIALFYNGGVIDLARIDALIDILPFNFGRLTKSTLKATLRPVVNKLLKSGSPDKIDGYALETLFSYAFRTLRSLAWVEKFFDTPSSIENGWSHDDLVTKIETAKKEKNNDARDLEALENILADLDAYPNLRVPGGKALIFDGAKNFTRDFLITTIIFEQGSSMFLSAYGSDPTHSEISVDNAGAAFSDFSPIAFEMKWLDKTSIGFHKKRFLEMDLFTTASNGDGWVNQYELVTYIHYIVSLKQIAADVRSRTETECDCQGKNCPEPYLSQVEDPLSWKWEDYSCFQNIFFSQFGDFWSHIPQLSKFYGSLDKDDHKSFKAAMETGGRRYGATNLPIGSYDVAQFSGLSHYVESIFYRFDKNKDQIIDTDETLAAFPVFKRTISNLSGIAMDEDSKLCGVFAYIIDHGKAPSKSFWGSVAFLYWMARKPFWNIKADRLSVYKVTSLFSVPEPVPAKPIEQ